MYNELGRVVSSCLYASCVAGDMHDFKSVLLKSSVRCKDEM